MLQVVPSRWLVGDGLVSQNWVAKCLAHESDFWPSLTSFSKEKMQDPIQNTKWNGNAEFPHHVLSRRCVILRACGNKCTSPWQNMHTVPSILPMGHRSCWKFRSKHGAFFMAEQHSWLSNLHVKASVLLVKHQSRKVSLWGVLRCVSSFVCGRIPLKKCRLSTREIMEAVHAQSKLHCLCGRLVLQLTDRWGWPLIIVTWIHNAPSKEQHAISDKTSFWAVQLWCLTWVHHSIKTRTCGLRHSHSFWWWSVKLQSFFDILKLVTFIC